jgi:hypothetical protein
MLKRMGLLLGMVSLAIASAANSYSVSLYQPTTVGGTNLKVGDIKVEVKDNKATLKQGKTVIEVPVKTETAQQKFVYTSVGYKDGNNHEIKDISLGGTTTRLVFE